MPARAGQTRLSRAATKGSAHRSLQSAALIVLALLALFGGWTYAQDETPPEGAAPAETERPASLDTETSTPADTPAAPPSVSLSVEGAEPEDKSPKPDTPSKQPEPPASPDAKESSDKSKENSDKSKAGNDKSKSEAKKDNKSPGGVLGSENLFDLKWQPESQPESEADSNAKPEAEEEPLPASGTYAGGSRSQGASAVELGIVPPVQLDVNKEELPLKMKFGNGIHFDSPDDQFTLRIHDETQIDGRDFSHVAPGSTTPALHDGFDIPRERLMFTGNVTPYMDYNVTLQSGIVGSFNIVNAYLDFGAKDPKYKELFHFRVGRFKTPYSYDWYKLHNWQMVTLERPLFPGNFTTNREVGAMAHGLLARGTFEYAAGVFDGSSNSDFSYNNGKDFIFYLDEAPFLHSDIPFLQYMHVAGSLATGVKYNIPNEFGTLRTASQGPSSSDEANVASPVFLNFNTGVVERGLRDLWAGDFYWFYGSYNLFLEYNGGFINYARSSTDAKVTRVPLEGFSITTSYFLTGERETQRVLPQPLHPIDGKSQGYGAWEVYSRFANINVGSNVFTAGLVDPTLWANRVNQTNTGVNWFLNKYIRITFEWQHSMFNQPVQLSTNKYMNTEDLYWMRFQLFY